MGWRGGLRNHPLTIYNTDNILFYAVLMRGGLRSDAESALSRTQVRFPIGLCAKARTQPGAARPHTGASEATPHPETHHGPLHRAHPPVPGLPPRGGGARPQGPVPRKGPVDRHRAVRVPRVLPDPPVRRAEPAVGRPVLLDACDPRVQPRHSHGAWHLADRHVRARHAAACWL